MASFVLEVVLDESLICLNRKFFENYGLLVLQKCVGHGKKLVPNQVDSLEINQHKLHQSLDQLNTKRIRVKLLVDVLHFQTVGNEFTQDPLESATELEHGHFIGELGLDDNLVQVGS